jgi:hypothetical protein
VLDWENNAFTGIEPVEKLNNYQMESEEILSEKNKKIL